MCEGIILPLITPLNDSGAVCEKSVEKLIEHVAEHSSAVICCLTMHKFHEFSIGHWYDMVDYTIKYAKNNSKEKGIKGLCLLTIQKNRICG